jgi:hypothetical protein
VFEVKSWVVEGGVTDFDVYEERAGAARDLANERWNHKYHARSLPDLKEGDRVWIKSPKDSGKEGEVVRRDKNPDSFWVRVGPSVLRRNRKHLFLLEGCHAGKDPPSGDVPLYFEGSDLLEEVPATGVEPVAERAEHGVEPEELNTGHEPVENDVGEGFGSPVVDTGRLPDIAPPGEGVPTPIGRPEYVTKRGRRVKFKRDSNFTYY